MPEFQFGGSGFRVDPKLGQRPYNPYQPEPVDQALRRNVNTLAELVESIDKIPEAKGVAIVRDYLFKKGAGVGGPGALVLDALISGRKLDTTEEAAVREQLADAARRAALLREVERRLAVLRWAAGLTNGLQLPMWRSDP